MPRPCWSRTSSCQECSSTAGKEQLSRVVTEPYRERTDIDGSDVRIEREGLPERRFSLRRSAELGGLLAAFASLLAGDRKALEGSFETTVEFLPGGWQLDLVPRQAGRRDRIGRIRVRGVGDTPACIAVVLQDGSTSSVVRWARPRMTPGGRPRNGAGPSLEREHAPWPGSRCGSACLACCSPWCCLASAEHGSSLFPSAARVA